MFEWMLNQILATLFREIFFFLVKREGIDRETVDTLIYTSK